MAVSCFCFAGVSSYFFQGKKRSLLLFAPPCSLDIRLEAWVLFFFVNSSHRSSSSATRRGLLHFTSTPRPLGQVKNTLDGNDR